MAKTVADQFAETPRRRRRETDLWHRRRQPEWADRRDPSPGQDRMGCTCGTRRSRLFAAGAEAHLTGELAVCAGSCGPGNLHLINGLFDCQRSRLPVLAIAAQIPSAELGAGYFQETHPESLFKECSHYCELISGGQPDAPRPRSRDPASGRQSWSLGRGNSGRHRPSARHRRGRRPKVAGLLPSQAVVMPNTCRRRSARGASQ